MHLYDAIPKAGGVVVKGPLTRPGVTPQLVTGRPALCAVPGVQGST